MAVNNDLVPLTFNKIMQSKSYTVFVLEAPEKRFAIYTDPLVGASIQTYVTERSKSRPCTHDLINALAQGLDVKFLQIVINDVEDTIFFAKLFVKKEGEKEDQILEIDSRPSDCLTLSLMNNIPLFCKKDVLEKIVPLED